MGDKKNTYDINEEKIKIIIDALKKNGIQLEFQCSYHEILFAYLQKTTKIDIVKRHREVADRLICDYFREYTKNSLQNIDGEKFLLNLQAKIEEAMEKIISSKSIYYWIHLYRRIGVMDIYGVNYQTLFLYRDILETAIKKYGKLKPEDEFIQLVNGSTEENIKQIADGLYLKALNYYKIDISKMNFYGGKCFKHFSDNNLLEIYSLEYLAYNYWWTTVCLRRLYKGGNFVLGLFPGQRWPFFVHAPKNLQKLMISLDERVCKYGEMVSSNGMPLNNHTDEAGYSVLCPVYNVKRVSTEQFPLEDIFDYNIISFGGKFISNFLWYTIDLYYYYQSHSFAKEKFFEKNNYSLVSFVCTIYLMLYENYIDAKTNREKTKEIIQRAYKYYTDYNAYYETLCNLYQRISNSIPFRLNEDELDDILKDLMIPKDRKIISLATRGPQYVLFEDEEHLVVDYYAIINIFENKIHGIETDGSSKGHDFEKVVKERLENSGISMWECAKKLKNKDGSCKEIDISFVYEGYLFIGELKCHTRPLNFDIGNKKYLALRQEKFERAIKQVNHKARWLQGYRNASNYKIPENVHTIVPFVISPFVEYIWDTSETLWITDDIPRICTIEECIQLCSEEVLKSVENKSYIVKLKK